jgi:hypothetical protein
VCASFDGVYCGFVLGAWRVVGVQLQLEVVALEDAAMAGSRGIRHLRELELLCVHPHPPPPSPGETAQSAAGATTCAGRPKTHTLPSNSLTGSLAGSLHHSQDQHPATPWPPFQYCLTHRSSSSSTWQTQAQQACPLALPSAGRRQ